MDEGGGEGENGSDKNRRKTKALQRTKTAKTKSGEEEMRKEMIRMQKKYKIKENTPDDRRT